MPRSASTGVYTLPTNSFAQAVTDTTISSTASNATQADYATALAYTPSTTRALYPTTGQVQDGAFMWGGTAGGTADALTITLTPAITAYAAGLTLRFVAASANATSTPTLAVNGLAPTVITRADGTPLLAGDMAAGAVIEIVYNATGFRLGGLAPSQVAGNDGATTTTSATTVTLTSASTRVQAVTMTADAQSVVLSDARTLTAGGPRYIIRNAGARPFGVRSSALMSLSNGDFTTSASWTLGTGWTIAAGVASKTAGVQADLSQPLTTAFNISYLVTFTITTASGGTVTPVFSGGGGDVLGTARSAPGTHTETIVSAGNTTFALRGSSTFVGSVDNVSVALAVPTLLASVPAGGVAECALESNATAAGSWTIGGRNLQPALTICDAVLPSTLTQSVEAAVRLSDTISVHFARNASGHPFVFAVDHGASPATVGTPVLIAAVNWSVIHAWAISNSKAAVQTDGGLYNIAVSGTTCTVSTSPGFTVSAAMTFSGPPMVAVMGANNDVLLSLYTSGANTSAMAANCSGTNPVLGSAVNIATVDAQQVTGIYRITATTAIAFYIDGAAAPFSLRGVVLSLSGTTITVGSIATVASIISGSPLSYPSCQLSTAAYVVSYYTTSGGAGMRAVAATVSGTTVTFGTPLVIESATFQEIDYNSFNGNRFQPNLYAVSATAALMTYGTDNTVTSANSRHVIITRSGTTLTAGVILRRVWDNITSLPAIGANFPQEAGGFLAIDGSSNRMVVRSITVSGTSLVPTGSYSPPFDLASGRTTRFGLSGGIRGIAYSHRSQNAFQATAGRLALFRFKANSAPIFLGITSPPNMDWPITTRMPVELAPTRVAITSLADASENTTATVKLAILEFAA